MSGVMDGIAQLLTDSARENERLQRELTELRASMIIREDVCAGSSALCRLRVCGYDLPVSLHYVRHPYLSQSPPADHEIHYQLTFRATYDGTDYAALTLDDLRDRLVEAMSHAGNRQGSDSEPS